jgi:uncharacterized membrane protein
LRRQRRREREREKDGEKRGNPQQELTIVLIQLFSFNFCMPIFAEDGADLTTFAVMRNTIY